ncbi:MAG: peptidoglycan DD-metalloendopeptidase family protein [Candidatus Sungbacteria bacterium]|nr:peptidoglycan DD-metalloendopeptidase family protein [Candidatus Sungbacteria bacterium]
MKTTERWDYKAAAVAVLVGFVMFFSYPVKANAGFFSDFLGFFGYSSRQQVVEEQSSGFFIRETQASIGSAAVPALESTLAGLSGRQLKAADDSGLTFVQDSAVVAPLNPLGTVSWENSAGQIFIYTVKRGDNPSVIAKSFGISLNTLLWANNLTNPRAIQPGDQLVILPISGVQIEVKKGDTIDSIAKKYRGNIGDILSYNGLSFDGLLEIGSTLVIPDGEFDWRPVETSGPSRFTSEISRYPSYDSYYIRPISGGRKSRGIHGLNGVDLANSCGLPVFASAGGTVILARSDGWNGGYGRYIVISHPNGTQTLYSHLKDVSVSVGQAVSQGLQIGTIGSTGNSTGCHVHFEVRGARNPF